MFDKMLRNLLESADPVESARHSFDHYHARWLCYVNLLRSERLTAKLYIFRPGAVAANADGYVVNPHSHGYNFHSYVVAGWMDNVIFEPGGDDAWCAHRYVSPLKGELRAEDAGRAAIQPGRLRHLWGGESYYLTTEQVHTIRVPSDRLTVLFLLQYHDVEQRETLLFTRNPGPPSLDGLYVRMQPERIAEELDLVRAVLRPAGSPVGEVSSRNWAALRPEQRSAS